MHDGLLLVNSTNSVVKVGCDAKDLCVLTSYPGLRWSETISHLGLTGMSLEKAFLPNFSERVKAVHVTTDVCLANLQTFAT